MPYKIVHSGSGFKVAKKHGGKTFSKKPLTKAKAVAQMKAIYANESSGISLVNLIDNVITEMENPPGLLGGADVEKEAADDNNDAVNPVSEDLNTPLKGGAEEQSEVFVKEPDGKVNTIDEEGDADVGEGNPEEKAVFGREPKNVTNEPVGVSGPKQDLIRPPGGGARI